MQAFATRGRKKFVPRTGHGILTLAPSWSWRYQIFARPADSGSCCTTLRQRDEAIRQRDEDSDPCTSLSRVAGRCCALGLSSRCRSAKDCRTSAGPRTPKGAVVAASYRNRRPPHGQAGLFLSRTVSAYENLAEIKKLGRSHPLLSSERVMTGQRLVSASLSPAFGGAFRSPQWHRVPADLSGYHRPAA